MAYLYKLFVSLILNFEIEVEDAKLQIVKIMQGKQMKKHNVKTEYKTIQHQEENGMIIISGCTGRFGRVLAMNNKAERTFGYGTGELVGERLDKLLPRVFGEGRHDELVLNFINGNRRINKENHQFVWGKHRSQFIIPLIMEINAYVNFEFNFCFIAFLKRSLLLEFKPMHELLDLSDLFVLQVSGNGSGVIQDMTYTLSEYLNFPVQALKKEVSVEALFKGILDEDNEQAYLNGKRVDFDPHIVRRILEQEDIDGKEVGAGGEDDEDELGSNYNLGEKKCKAVVWMRSFDYAEQDVDLSYKEIWFVLTEEEAAGYMDTRTNDGLQVTDGKEAAGVGGGGNNMSYSEDREEICSIASMSSLANYDKNRKNIMAKLSEIKT